MNDETETSIELEVVFEAKEFCLQLRIFFIWKKNKRRFKIVSEDLEVRKKILLVYVDVISAFNRVFNKILTLQALIHGRV